MNERMVVLLPAAVYALCTGCVPPEDCYKGFLNATGDWLKVFVCLIFHGLAVNLDLITFTFSNKLKSFVVDWWTGAWELSGSFWMFRRSSCRYQSEFLCSGAGLFVSLPKSSLIFILFLILIHIANQSLIIFRFHNHNGLRMYIFLDSYNVRCWMKWKHSLLQP